MLTAYQSLRGSLYKSVITTKKIDKNPRVRQRFDLIWFDFYSISSETLPRNFWLLFYKNLTLKVKNSSESERVSECLRWFSWYISCFARVLLKYDVTSLFNPTEVKEREKQNHDDNDELCRWMKCNNDLLNEWNEKKRRRRRQSKSLHYTISVTKSHNLKILSDFWCVALK